MWPVRLEQHHVEKLDQEKRSDDPAFEFIFVTAIRDPIVRLISAYKDKIGNRFIFLTGWLSGWLSMKTGIEIGKRKRRR